MRIFASFRRHIERFLYRSGFVLPVARHLLSTQALIASSSLIAGLILIRFTLWPLAFGSGALIATYSLWHIIRFAQLAIRQQFSIALGFRLGMNCSARLLLIGLVLFALIVPLKAPVAPLLMGLSSTVVGIVLWGISKASRKTI